MTAKRLEEMTLEEIADWVASTCLMLGSQVSTAHKVAATFVEGLEKVKKKEVDRHD